MLPPLPPPCREALMARSTARMSFSFPSPGVEYPASRADPEDDNLHFPHYCATEVAVRQEGGRVSQSHICAVVVQNHNKMDRYAFYWDVVCTQSKIRFVLIWTTVSVIGPSTVPCRRISLGMKTRHASGARVGHAAWFSSTARRGLELPKFPTGRPEGWR